MMISIQNKQPGMVAYLEMTGSYDQTSEGFGRLVEYLEAHELKPTSMPLAIYYNIASDPSGADAVWELQRSVADDTPEADPDENGVGVKQMPAMTVASAVHTGPYHTVLPTYQALWDWIEDNGHELAGPPMERYLNDSSTASPEEYLTEVIMPIRKA